MNRMSGSMNRMLGRFDDAVDNIITDVIGGLNNLRKQLLEALEVDLIENDRKWQIEGGVGHKPRGPQAHYPKKNGNRKGKPKGKGHKGLGLHKKGNKCWKNRIIGNQHPKGTALQ